MSKKQPAPQANLPADFFDSDKKSKKAQEEELKHEFEQFEKELANLQRESEQQLKAEFEEIQDEKNEDQFYEHLELKKRLSDLEKKAEALRAKSTGENPKKKLKASKKESDETSDEEDLGNIEDLEDKLFDWRSKSLC